MQVPYYYVIIYCRHQESMEKECPYILTDPEVYSLNDLVQIKNGDYLSRIRSLVDMCIKHVSDCQVRNIYFICFAKGHLFSWLSVYISSCVQLEVSYVNCANVSTRYFHGNLIKSPDVTNVAVVFILTVSGTQINLAPDVTESQLGKMPISNYYYY